MNSAQHPWRHPDGETDAADRLRQCKAAREAPEPTCGPASLLNRSYPLLARWPLSRISLVMETHPLTCDLYADAEKCCGLADV